jgi:hypothetical protein
VDGDYLIRRSPPPPPKDPEVLAIEKAERKLAAERAEKALINSDPFREKVIAILVEHGLVV